MEDEEDEEITFEKRFGWYVIINRVSADDITKHDTVFQKTLVEVLNQTSYLIEKDREIERVRKKMMSGFS